MEPQSDNKTGAIRPWILITLIVLIIAAVGSFVWYYLQKNNALPLPTTTLTATPVVTPKTTPKISPTTAASISTTDWKTYENKELGFSFEYPDNWSTIEFNKLNRLLTQGDFLDTNARQRSDGTSDQIVIDPLDIFSFMIPSKNFESFYFGRVTDKAIDLNWNQEEFKKNVQTLPNDIVAFRKFGKNSIMTIQSGGYECSPIFAIYFYIPLKNSDYPNLILTLNLDKFINNDQIIKDYVAKVGDQCDLLDLHKEIGDKIMDGDYSEELTRQIEIARNILDSLVYN